MNRNKCIVIGRNMNIFQISCSLVFESNKSISFYLLRGVRTSVELTSPGSQDLCAKTYRKEHCGGKSQMDKTYFFLFILQECRLASIIPRLLQGIITSTSTSKENPDLICYCLSYLLFSALHYFSASPYVLSTLICRQYTCQDLLGREITIPEIIINCD